MIEKSEDYDDYLQVYKVYADYDLKADGASYLEQALKLTEQAKKTLTIKAEFIIIWKNMTRQKKNFRVLMKMDIKMLQFILERFMQSWGDIDNAKSMYQECLNEKGYQAKAYNGLAYCNILEEDYASALKNIQKGLDAGDEEEKQGLLFNEIVVYEKTSDFATAKEKIAEYLKLYPSDRKRR